MTGWKGGVTVRRLITAGLTVLLLLLLATTASAEGTVVTSLHTDCAVEADGACTLTLRISVNFAPGTETFSIPIDPAAKDVSCSLPHSLRNGDGCRLVTLSGALSGPMELTVSYRLAETVTDDGDHHQFAVQLLFPAWTCAIEAYEVTVRFPGVFDALPTFYSGYYGDLIDNYMTISIDRGQVHAVLNSKQTLQDHEAMSMRLQLPRDFFDLRFLAGKTVPVDRLLFLALLVLTVLYWAVFLRNLPILPRRQVMPPAACGAGEIPFVLTNRAPDLALMVVQWASLGYLTLTRTRRGRVTLTRLMDMDTERRKLEGEIFRTLFSRGDLCDVRSAEYWKAKNLAAEKARKFWQNRVYDPKAGAPVFFRLLALAAGLALCLACFDLWVASKSWRWLLILALTLLGGAACLALQQLGGALLRRHSLRTLLLGGLGALYLAIAGKGGGLVWLMLLNIAAQTAVGLLLRCGGRRTKAGMALAAELLGYRRWLLSADADQLHTNLAADPQFFYRVLPYADALRAGRYVAVTLAETRLEGCDWLNWEGKPARTAFVFYGRYCRLLSALRGEREPGARRRAAAAAQRTVSTKTVLPRRPADRRAPARRPGRTGGRP